jgi:hypothetical protein
MGSQLPAIVGWKPWGPSGRRKAERTVEPSGASNRLIAKQFFDKRSESKFGY